MYVDLERTEYVCRYVMYIVSINIHIYIVYLYIYIYTEFHNSLMMAPY